MTERRRALKRLTETMTEAGYALTSHIDGEQVWTNSLDGYDHVHLIQEGGRWTVARNVKGPRNGRVAVGVTMSEAVDVIKSTLTERHKQGNRR